MLENKFKNRKEMYPKFNTIDDLIKFLEEKKNEYTGKIHTAFNEGTDYIEAHILMEYDSKYSPAKVCGENEKIGDDEK